MLNNFKLVIPFDWSKAIEYHLSLCVYRGTTRNYTGSFTFFQLLHSSYFIFIESNVDFFQFLINLIHQESSS